MAVALITWGGVLLYLVRLELMARRLKRQLHDEEMTTNVTPRAASLLEEAR